MTNPESEAGSCLLEALTTYPPKQRMEYLVMFSWSKEMALGKADLHIHSVYSDGAETIEDILAYVERRTDLDVIAITDHDCIDGALRARDAAAHARLRVQVIAGEEVSTREGHLLALNVERRIAPGLSMAETVAAIHQQGGLTIAAHPLSRWVASASSGTLLALADTLDGLEVCNASFAGMGSNLRARALNRMHLHLAETGGSDAHTLDAIGSSYTTFPGSNAVHLLAALRARRTLAQMGYWSVGTFLRYGYHALRQRILLGSA